MCGIAGLVNREGLCQEDRSWLKDSLYQISHRGPDASGIWMNHSAGFSHARLAIIDLEGGSQPMHDASERYTITYNGEIYNFKTIRAELESKKYKFRTQSDTEVILNAYAEWDTECVEHFNGIFAFGIWDQEERNLFLARDHLGVKPLLYCHRQNILIFSSELKAIRQHPIVDEGVDPRAFSDYLSLGYILTPKTILKAVQKLPPATWLRWNPANNKCLIRRYWDLAGVVSGPKESLNVPEAIEALHACLDRSVRRQLVSDVPLGAFLSGGLDSSTIVQKMLRHSTGSVQTYSMGFLEKSYSELPFSRMVAENLGVENIEEMVSPNLPELLPRLVWYYDEPFSDTSAVPTFMLCKLARRHVKVSLSGDGGDECFAGYETYIADRLQALYRRIPGWMHRCFFLPVVNALPSTQRKVSLDYKLKQFVYNARKSPEEAHYKWRLIFSEEQKQALCGESFMRELDGYTPLEVFLDYYKEVNNASPLSRSQYVDIKTWLADGMLVKIDRASMSHGLEVRVPFLDPELVESAMRLPDTMKLHVFETKYLLKKAMVPFLPREVIWRSKRGFNAPAAQWVNLLSDHVTEFECDFIAGFDAHWKRLLEEHQERQADHGFRLWTLLCWVFWMQEGYRSIDNRVPI